MLAVLSVHFGGKHSVPPSQGPPEPCSSLSSGAGHLLSWAAKTKSPLLMLCPSQLLLESLCLQVTCDTSSRTSPPPKQLV